MKRRKVMADWNLRMKHRIISREFNQKPSYLSPHPPSIRLEGRRKLLSLLRAALLETTQVQITHLPVHLSKLPSEFHRFRIIQLSDVHHSSFVSEAEITTAAQRVNELQPDLIVLTGDYVSHSVDFIPGCARALGKLRAKHGVFAVLGNHDHWTDGQLMKTALESQGIRVLCNENERIEKDGAHICLAGVDDMLVKLDDMKTALADTLRSETRILLAHNPALIREAARAGVDLMLSGHTHGGQIDWKLLVPKKETRLSRWLRRPSRKFMRGLAVLGNTQLYVNRGFGTVVVPLRYGCTPEITLIELHK
ncbi:MAG: metallophosphoesterase [Blastocatellia bacterium]|nr:metallophosphoesterase [Blastocatellia bacterium]